MQKNCCLAIQVAPLQQFVYLRPGSATATFNLFCEHIVLQAKTIFIEENHMAHEKWEYMTEFVWASAEGQGVKEYLKKRWPDFKPDKFSPETMIPRLNNMGAAGWELVSIQPVYVGSNSDVILPEVGSGANTLWTHIYFCAFKRRITE
jgi:hypothetical protein